MAVLRLGRSRTSLASGEMLISHAALAAAVKDAFPGLIGMRVAPVSGAGDSLARGAQAALPARPESLGAGAAFSPAPSKDAAVLRRARSAPPGLACPARRRLAVNRRGWPARYEIRVDSVLDDQWADWSDGLQLSNDGAQTVIVGLLPDQPVLHGLLTKIGDLGLSLITVRRLDA